MQQIRMVDLAGQHERIKDALNEAIADVMTTTSFIRGPQVAAFEKELASYVQVQRVIGCANGTDALQLALMALELPAGSEVITPDFTFVATAEVVRLLGHTPVLVDVDPDTFNIDVNRLEEAITDKTKAVIPVHLFGQCANMEAIMDIASRYQLYVIEDTAQAIGTDYTFSDGRRIKAGTIGHFGATSFFPSKNLGCMGDGGALFTNDAALGRMAGIIANHGMDEQYLYEKIGINSRLDSLQAAMLRVKLQQLDDYNQRRQAAATYYDEAFANTPQLQTPVRSSFSTHTFHQYTLRVLEGSRDGLMEHLNKHNIPNKVYYPVPIHRNKPYAHGSRFDADKLGVSRMLSEQAISLPMHTELTEDQLAYITQTVNQYFK